ncbi:hypothetical protein IV203_019401 [Nitzschia inconspicua]|uniref:Uncharacterized protein n=1 Tax=Nitzschia inconspicua TaxID=303405 RepID=A0A9K3M2F4_9STRA|nr:hypothetical protein IV203_019401 [Nitzschia inconspicua]
MALLSPFMAFPSKSVLRGCRPFMALLSPIMASPSKSPLPSTATICVSCAPADPSAIVLLNSRPSVITRTQAPLLAPGRHTICLVYLSPGCIPTRSAHARAGHWLMFTACPHPPHFYRSPDSLMYEISLWRAPIPTVGSRSSSLISHKGITKVDPFFVLVSFPFLPTSNPDYQHGISIAMGIAALQELCAWICVMPATLVLCLSSARLLLESRLQTLVQRRTRPEHAGNDIMHFPCLHASGLS